MNPALALLLLALPGGGLVLLGWALWTARQVRSPRLREAALPQPTGIPTPTTSKPEEAP